MRRELPAAKASALPGATLPAPGSVPKAAPSLSERVKAASDAKHLAVPGGCSLERQPPGFFSSAFSVSPAGFIATNPASLGLQALVAMDSGGGAELSTKTNKTCDNENTSGLYDSARQLQLRCDAGPAGCEY